MIASLECYSITIIVSLQKLWGKLTIKFLYLHKKKYKEKTFWDAQPENLAVSRFW